MFFSPLFNFQCKSLGANRNEPKYKCQRKTRRVINLIWILHVFRSETWCGQCNGFFWWLTTKKIEQKIQFSQFEEIDDGREGGMAWRVIENMQNILFRACVFSREKTIGKMRVDSVKPYRWFAQQMDARMFAGDTGYPWSSLGLISKELNKQTQSIK